MDFHGLVQSSVAIDLPLTPTTQEGREETGFF